MQLERQHHISLKEFSSADNSKTTLKRYNRTAYLKLAMLGPVIYGIFFYHRPIQLGRVVAAKITVALLVNLLLGTWWLTILYGKGFLAILPARFIKQVVSVPIDSVIFYVLAKTLERSKAISMIKK